jgi:hypothetical protein
MIHEIEELQGKPETGTNNVLGKVLAVIFWGIASILLFAFILFAMFFVPILWDYVYGIVLEQFGMSTGIYLHEVYVEVDPSFILVQIASMFLLSIGGWFFWTGKLKKGFLCFIACLILVGVAFLLSTGNQHYGIEL